MMEGDEIIDNEGNLISIEKYVQKLRKEKNLKKFYILSIGVWMKYFENISDTSLEKRYILERIHDINLLKKHFSNEEWPDLYKTDKKLGLLSRGINN